MIKSWKHKGLYRFYKAGDTSGINSKHVVPLKAILQRLDVATSGDQMRSLNKNFHKLKGDKKDYFAVTVRANWRVTFQFEGKDAILVNYEDYH
jgi:proteic killer suppression protein